VGFAPNVRLPAVLSAHLVPRFSALGFGATNNHHVAYIGRVLVFSVAKNPILSIAMNLDVPVRPTIVAIGLFHAIWLGLKKLDRERISSQFQYAWDSR
jgi:hypothetical protein